MIVRMDSTLEAAQRYVSRCRAAGDMRPFEALLREVVDHTLAARLSAELLARAWRP